MKTPALLWMFLLAVLCLAGCKSTPKTDLPEYAADTPMPAELIEAQNFIDQGKPKKACKILVRWIPRHENHPHMDEALWLKAQTYLDRKKYYHAGETYEKLLKDHSASNHFSEVLARQVDIAERFLKGHKRRVMWIFKIPATTDAIEMLDKVSQRWPGSPLAARAIMMQADFFYGKKRYDEAQQTYQLIADHYQTSEHYRRALWQNAQATFEQFTGAEYDSTPLQEAKIRYTLCRGRLPDDVEETRIDQRLTEIEELLAQKEVTIGDYYQRTEKHQQAGYSWRYVMDRWPDSFWAKQAQRRLKFEKGQNPETIAR